MICDNLIINKGNLHFVLFSFWLIKWTSLAACSKASPT